MKSELTITIEFRTFLRSAFIARRDVVPVAGER